MNATPGQRIYPMRYNGGLFLCCVGAAIVLGALLGGKAFGMIVIAGFILGVIAIVTARPFVARKFGAPSRRHILLMIAAVSFELAGFALLAWLTSGGVLPGTDEFLWAGVLVIVALHFLLMRWSFSGWTACLGIAILIWVAVATWLNLTVGVLLLGDGVLTLGFGAIMAAPLFTSTKMSDAN